jgi:hypothetical protein
MTLYCASQDRLALAAPSLGSRHTRDHSQLDVQSVG